MIYNNGDVYEGNYVCGIKEGDGIYIHKVVNSKYEGNWHADAPHGYGIFHF